MDTLCEVLIFVIDSYDRESTSECKEELWRFLEEEELKDAVVLIMANKQDLHDAMSPSEIAEVFFNCQMCKEHLLYLVKV